MSGPTRAGLLAALVLALPLAGCTTGSRTLLATPRPQTPPPATMVHLADVRTGMCLDADRLPRDGKVAYLEALGCGTDHTGEVFAVVSGAPVPADPAPADPVPGDPCTDAFEPYVGVTPDRSTVSVRVLTASAEGWDRAAPAPTVCVAVSADPITGSLRGTGR